SRFRKQRDTAWNQNTRQGTSPGKRHHHGRQSLVARRHTHHSVAGGQRANLAAKHLGCVVSVRQTVHHASRSLGTPVARVSTKRSERQAILNFEFFRGRLHQQSNFPVSRMVAECHRSSIGVSNPALSTQDQELLSSQLIWAPSHAGVLAVGKEIAARRVAQHVLRDGYTPTRSTRLRLEVKDCWILRVEDAAQGNVRRVLLVQSLAPCSGEICRTIA